nr:hypothetical protein [Enterococcus gallinarum]
MKTNERYTYRHIIGNHSQYSYSYATITFIINEIKKDPKNIIKSLKKEIKKRT